MLEPSDEPFWSDQVQALESSQTADSSKPFRLEAFIFSCFLQIEKQLQEEQQEKLRAPEFIKVKENLRRTSFQNDEKV